MKLEAEVSRNSNNEMIPLLKDLGDIPTRREYVPLPAAEAFNNDMIHSKFNNPVIIRVLQFNVLADGLAGLRSDLGDFSRVSNEILSWKHRRKKLLNEIIQYAPDIITLQEVDHYYDFFLPELRKRGYLGCFAPKPTSKCLEVSNNSDGCALFVKKSKLRIVSVEAKTLALSIAGMSESGELLEEDKNIMAQNQVALIAICELVDNSTPNSTDIEAQSLSNNVKVKTPNIIVCTTHLKSSKTNTGERYRQKGITQILESINKINKSLQQRNIPSAVILSGDLNAVTNDIGYEPLTYRAIKSQDLRSVYNEDVSSSRVPLSSKQLYTNWKFQLPFSINNNFF